MLCSRVKQQMPLSTGYLHWYYHRTAFYLHSDGVHEVTLRKLNSFQQWLPLHLALGMSCHQDKGKYHYNDCLFVLASFQYHAIFNLTLFSHHHTLLRMCCISYEKAVFSFAGS